MLRKLAMLAAWLALVGLSVATLLIRPESKAIQPIKPDPPIVNITPSQLEGWQLSTIGGIIARCETLAPDANDQADWFRGCLDLIQTQLNSDQLSCLEGVPQNN